MEPTLRRKDVPEIGLPFCRHVDTDARNCDNPHDPVGVFHNVQVGYVATATATARLDGSSPSRELVMEQVREVLSEADRWSPLYCVCVHEQGCPCSDVWTWLTDAVARRSVEEALATLEEFPDEHLTADEVLELVRREIPEREYETFSRASRRLVEEVEDVTLGNLGVSEFYRNARRHEKRLLGEGLDPLVRDTPLVGVGDRPQLAVQRTVEQAGSRTGTRVGQGRRGVRDGGVHPRRRQLLRGWLRGWHLRGHRLGVHRGRPLVREAPRGSVPPGRRSGTRGASGYQSPSRSGATRSPLASAS